LDNVAAQRAHPLIREEQNEARVTPLELFFDLVFVFALTQVTAFMADELSWQGILRGVLVIMLLWWAWTGYAWLANVASAEERPIKLAILTGMAAMFVLYVSDRSHHTLTEPLSNVALAAFVGGAVIYLLGHVVFKWLTVHTLSVVRLVAAGVLLLITPTIAGRPALVELGVVSVLVALGVFIESVIFAESRRKIRAELAPH
jgi:low temperature requirement protein LtrA